MMLTAPDPHHMPPTFCNVERWCGAGANYIAIWGSSATDIWIIADGVGPLAGAKGTLNANRFALLHWNGSAWTASQFDVPSGLASVSGTASDDVWVVGSGGFIAHFDGQKWSPTFVPGSPDLTIVSAVGRNDVWAGGQKTLRFDGREWRVQHPTSDDERGDVTRALSSSAGDVWLAGDSSLRHFDQKAWTTLVAGPRNPGDVDRSYAITEGRAITSVWGRGAAFIAGRWGLLLRWDDGSWTHQQVAGQSGQANYRGLWGSAEDDVWALGERGALAHWDGKGWSSGPHLTEFDLNAAWGVGGKTWVVGDHGAFLELGGQGDAGSVVSGLRVTRLWGSSVDDVWAVGRDAAHWDGVAWTQVHWPATETTLAIWGSSSSDVWAAGEKGQMLHWSGAAWSRVELQTDADVGGVWGSAQNDVWAVDADGKFRHFDGLGWTIWQGPNFGPLRSVWGRTANDVIAVGGARRLRFDGVQWSLLPGHPSQDPSYLVAFGGPGRVWIGGQVVWSAAMAGGAYAELGLWNGMVLADDREPRDVELPPGWGNQLNLSEVSVVAGWAGADDDVWLALPMLVHWDGQRWRRSPTAGDELESYNERVTALWGTSRDLWAIISPGQILRRQR